MYSKLLKMFEMIIVSLVLINAPLLNAQEGVGDVEMQVEESLINENSGNLNDSEKMFLLYRLFKTLNHELRNELSVKQVNNLFSSFCPKFVKQINEKIKGIEFSHEKGVATIRDILFKPKSYFLGSYVLYVILSMAGLVYMWIFNFRDYNGSNMANIMDTFSNSREIFFKNKCQNLFINAINGSRSLQCIFSGGLSGIIDGEKFQQLSNSSYENFDQCSQMLGGRDILTFWMGINYFGPSQSDNCNCPDYGICMDPSNYIDQGLINYFKRFTIISFGILIVGIIPPLLLFIRYLTSATGLNREEIMKVKLENGPSEFDLFMLSGGNSISDKLDELNSLKLRNHQEVGELDDPIDLNGPKNIGEKSHIMQAKYREVF